MNTQESEPSFSYAGGLCLGRAHGGLEIFGDAWHDIEQDLHVPQADNVTDLVDHLPEAIRVRLAHSREVCSDAGLLVQRRYEARGYQVRRTVADPALYTFAAYAKGKLVGTMGVRLDSPDGLKIEQIYRPEVTQLRERGLRLVEFTRLAVAESVPSKEVLGALFHTAVLFSHRVCGRTNVVIEVNPRHVAFYRRMLFFKPIGPERHLDRVGAPAVALALDFATLAAALDDFFSRPDWRERTNSFFVQWFAPADAEGVLDRLERLEQERQTLRAHAEALYQEGPGKAARAFSRRASGVGLGLAA